MHRSALSPTLLLLATGLAGCLQDDSAEQGLLDGQVNIGVDYEYYLDLDFPIDLDHDHSDPALHVAHFQTDFVAHHACTADGKYKAGMVAGFTDIAFHGDLAFVGKSDGFCILDVTDPNAPKFVSHYQGEGAADLEVSADGNYVFLLTQRNAAPGPLSRGSTDPTDNLPRGVIVVNAKDKKNPQFESYYPVPTNGVHTAVSYEMTTQSGAKRQLLSIQTYDWATPVAVGPVPQANMPVTQRVEITELRANAAGRMSLERLSMFSLPRPTTDPLVYYFPHDAYVQKHPFTNQTLLYIAYWDAGLAIVDITSPAMPRLVSTFSERAPSKYNAYHDVKVSETLIAGRHITVTGPELPSAVGETGHFRIFDTTDPKKPVQLGTWTLPGVPGFSGGFQFSPHVFQVVDGRIYLAHNHGGIWIIDIQNETLLREPKAAGYYFPHGDERDPTSWAQSASVWGAYVHKGVVYATETRQGVHALRWVGDSELSAEAMTGGHVQ